jgi:hypothetical protein
LPFKELKEGEKEEKVLTYTNEGPGEWHVVGEGFAALKGSVFAWESKAGAKPCFGQKIPVGGKCETIIEFKPNEEKTTFQAEFTTNEPSEAVRVEGKSK